MQQKTKVNVADSFKATMLLLYLLLLLYYLILLAAVNTRHEADNSSFSKLQGKPRHIQWTRTVVANGSRETLTS